MNSCSNQNYTKKQEQNLIYKHKSDFVLIEMNGKSYDKGYLHGRILKEEIGVQIKKSEEKTHAVTRVSQEQLYEIVLKETGFIKAIEKYTPELLDEIYGIADGAGIDRKKLLLYNLGEEIMSFYENKYESCTTVGIRNKTNNTVAYNQDLLLFLHGNNKPVILKEDNVYIFAIPGSIGISGMSKYIAITCNSLPMLNMDKNGLPLSFMIRKLLRFSSLEDAKQYLLNTPLAIPQNILLMDFSQILDFECSGNQIKQCSNKKSNRFIYHTNYPLVNFDYRKNQHDVYKCSRFNYLDSIFSNLYIEKDITVNEIDKIMSKSEPYYVHNPNTYVRFIGTYYHDNNKLPYLKVINPQKKGESIILRFN